MIFFFGYECNFIEIHAIESFEFSIALKLHFHLYEFIINEHSSNAFKISEGERI